MPKNKTDIDRVIANVQASMAVEGLTPSREAKAIGKKYLAGELTSQEAIDAIKRNHTVRVKK